MKNENLVEQLKYFAFSSFPYFSRTEMASGRNLVDFGSRKGRGLATRINSKAGNKEEVLLELVWGQRKERYDHRLKLLRGPSRVKKRHLGCCDGKKVQSPGINEEKTQSCCSKFRHNTQGLRMSLRRGHDETLL